MKLAWSDEALAELSAIVFYIAKDNPGAAGNLAESMYTGTEQLLTTHPNLGRKGRVNGTLELVIHASYIIVYQIEKDKIIILGLRHTARLWPKLFK